MVGPGRGSGQGEEDNLQGEEDNLQGEEDTLKLVPSPEEEETKQRVNHLQAIRNLKCFWSEADIQVETNSE